MVRQKIIAFILLILFSGFNIGTFAADIKYPDYACEFLSNDKHETFNRKMFNFNLGLNKYFIRPVHILWASILPQYGMDRIFGVSNNIEFPIRLVSSLVQRDFHNAGNETKRFFINTTIGLGGMFDPAKRYFKIERSRDNMDKALARCNVKPGAYFVAPIINFTTVRGLFGRTLDAALNPSTYIGTPVLAAIKAAIVVNRTSYLQSIIQMLEANFVDPYYITKLAFGIDGYIKKNNYDRVDVMSTLRVEDSGSVVSEKNQKTKLLVSAKMVNDDNEYGSEGDWSSLSNLKNKGKNKKSLKKQRIAYEKTPLIPDIYLKDYAPQSPVVDSMRTMLFELPDATKSMWNELSPWNRSFVNRTKTASVNVFEGRNDYTFRYLMQKNKKAPLAVIYPSTGDGINAGHPLMFAKLFYDAGFSVVIEGNPFQWEFVQSMPEGYVPGLPSRDAIMMRKTTEKIVEKLQTKYKHKFENKVVFGTSLAGLDVLYIAEQESKENTLGNAKFIAICPPIDLVYSMNLLDKYTEEWVNYSEDLKQKVAFASAKLVKLYQSKDDIDFSVNHLPFDEDEAKLFTSFVMHQKLSNVIFELEKAPKNKKSDIYEMMGNMDFFDYFAKYIMSDTQLIDKDLENGFGIAAIADYMKTADNYKVYHTLNDYLINRIQLKQLRYLAGNKLVLIDNGSHMGFLYREEFLTDFRQTLSDLYSGMEVAVIADNEL